MGSYSIDNAVATQGRYADIVATSRPLVTQPKNKNQFNASGNVEAKSYLPENALPHEENAEEAFFPMSKEQQLKAEIFNNEEAMNDITATLNDFVSQWNNHLQFSVHEETSMLTVKVVDLKSNKVLKEFPPEEYLDMIAKIREFIGSMIDEKI